MTGFLRERRRQTATIQGPSLRDHGRLAIRKRRREREESGGGNQKFEPWALLVPERGVVLNFERFPYQREWYSEEVALAEAVVWQKAAQVGMSTLAWRWAAWRAERDGENVIYFFPTADDVTAFGEMRIEPSIESSELLSRAIPQDSVRRKGLKQIGAGFLSLRGTMSRASVQSVDADAIVFDEHDYCHQGNLAHAERRIAGARQAGRTPRVRRLGYPTDAGYGINKLYDQSDKRVWMVECPECDLEQQITFEHNLRWRTHEDSEIQRWGDDRDWDDPKDVYEVWRCCSECGASLESDTPFDGPVANGRWVATASSSTIGYHVNRLIVPEGDLASLVTNSRKTAAAEVEAFWQNDLGLPFTSSEAALSAAEVDASCSQGYHSSQVVKRPRSEYLFGLDMASERDLSLWIAELGRDGKLRTVSMTEPSSGEEALEEILRWGCAFGVIDSMPERRTARGIAARIPGRATIATYTTKDTSPPISLDEKKNMVTLHRTEALDAMIDGVRQQRILMMQDASSKHRAQMQSPKRRTRVTQSGASVREYVSTGSEGDDMAHAGVFLLAALDLWRMRQTVRAEVERRSPRRVPQRKKLRDDIYRAGLE